MTLFYATLGASILLGVAGQALLKMGASSETLLRQVLAPQSIIGLGLYFVAGLCYMFALRKIPVSVAFPSVSLSYVVVTLLAYWMFGETLNYWKIAGIVMICSGVFLIAAEA